MEKLTEKLKAIEMVKSKKPFSLLEILYKQVHSKELVQSKMLAGLLNPDENHGHGSNLVESFLSYVDVDIELQKDSNLKVETERNVNGRRIDILISWLDNDKKHAVIIENKLNNAQNQINQLNDYHDSIVSEGYKIDRIVYMPLSKKLQSSKHTDTKENVLAKTKDFDAQDILGWLCDFIREGGFLNEEHSAYNYQTDAMWQYMEFLKCLISNQYLMQQITEIQEKFTLEEVNKIEKLAELTRTEEWCEIRFRTIVKEILKENFTRNLIVKYKQNGNYVNYAQFYFDNWEKTYWYEVWLYPEDGNYLYKYESKDKYSKLRKFEIAETAELVKHIVPLLQELSKITIVSE